MEAAFFTFMSLPVTTSLTLFIDIYAPVFIGCRYLSASMANEFVVLRFAIHLSITGRSLFTK